MNPNAELKYLEVTKTYIDSGKPVTPEAPRKKKRNNPGRDNRPMPENTEPKDNVQDISNQVSNNSQHEKPFLPDVKLPESPNMKASASSILEATKPDILNSDTIKPKLFSSEDVNSAAIKDIYEIISTLQQENSKMKEDMEEVKLKYKETRQLLKEEKSYRMKIESLILLSEEKLDLMSKELRNLTKATREDGEFIKIKAPDVVPEVQSIENQPVLESRDFNLNFNQQKLFIAVSEAMTRQQREIEELKSIISAEITARRKYQSKIQILYDKVVTQNEQEIFNIRKELLHLSETLGVRIHAIESSDNIHRQTMIAQIADSRSAITDNIASIRYELDSFKRDTKYNYENQIYKDMKELDLRINDFERNFRKTISSSEKVYRDMISELNQEIEMKFSSIENSNKSEDNFNLVQKLIASKLSQQDNKINFEIQKLTTMVDSIVLLKEVSEKHTNQIGSLEDQLKDSFEKGKIEGQISIENDSNNMQINDIAVEE